MRFRRDDQTHDRPRIVQCCREIAPGGGVSGVAAQLEAGFRQAGYDCQSVTLRSVGLTAKRIHASRAVNKLFLLRDVLWYSVVGTMYAKLRYSRRGAVIICHNDVLIGHIYVNHGLHKLVVARSPHPIRMVLRNPLHLFLLIREEIRHRLGIHDRVVTLSANDARDMALAYPSTRGKIARLANGVQVDKFAEARLRRDEVRQATGASDDQTVLLFVGHEFDRKGLHFAIESLVHLHRRVVLWVVGGSDSMISTARAEAQRMGVDDRVTFFGTRRTGVEAFFGAADLFVLPSAYEAAALVGLEAMAAGAVPIMTPVGSAPDLITHGTNGYLIERTAEAIREAVRDATRSPDRLATMSKLAAESAREYDWPRVVDRYLDLVREVYASRRRG
jgi:glycosyltransferase involved in cell wall biosynthesis